MRRFHGKPLDVTKLKQPVMRDLRGHARKVRELAEYLRRHETPCPQEECYICHGRAQEPFAEIFGFPYVRCADCGHVYTTERFAADALDRFYQQQDYYSEITYANKETCFYRRDHVAQPKFEFARRFLDGDGGIWLDVGAGIGDLVSVAAERGWDARGLEISESSVRFAEEVFGIGLERQKLGEFCEENPDLQGALRVVSFLGVLEHVVDPMQMLRQAHRLLADDGKLLVQVPNADSLSSEIQTVFPENVSRHLVPYSHIMLFSERSLTTALEQSGFELEALWYLGLDVYELVNNLVLLNEELRESRLYELLIESLNPLQQVFDERHLSDGLICLAGRVGSA